ncbi:MAG: M28 family peptidase [Planctomycetota bacterium]|nr:M28 family peptidase [Planctomycetota bacterium]
MNHARADESALQTTVVAHSSHVVLAEASAVDKHESEGKAEAAELIAIAVDLVPAITRAEIEAHVRFLAADERAGRVTGTKEAELCARYLARVFEKSGLAPAGDDGTYLQRVPVHKDSWSAAPELTLTDAGGTRNALVYGRDFDGGQGFAAGSGMQLVVARDTDSLPKAADKRLALFFDAPAAERRDAFEAAKLGTGEGFGLLIVPGFAKTPTNPAALPQSRLARSIENKPETPRAVRVHGEALKSLRAAGKVELAFDSNKVREDLTAYNVVAKIVGVGTPENKSLADEALVVTAHYDHIDHGHGASKPGEDTIYNGADDDASGTAAVLEIAGAMAKDKAPARTVVFCLVTGEEVGLLGTEEYLDRPLVPLAKTVLNLNFEMIGRPDQKIGGVGKLWLTGHELSNLGAKYTEMKLDIFPDPYPNEHFFERSDNIAFVRRGVVGQTLSSYNLHKDYHRPSDEADTLDFVHLEGCAQAGLEAVRVVASGALTPAWIEGREPRMR